MCEEKGEFKGFQVKLADHGTVRCGQFFPYGGEDGTPVTFFDSLEAAELYLGMFLFPIAIVSVFENSEGERSYEPVKILK